MSRHPQRERGQLIEAAVLAELMVRPLSAPSLQRLLPAFSDRGIRMALQRLRAKGQIVAEVDRQDDRYPTIVWRTRDWRPPAAAEQW